MNIFLDSADLEEVKITKDHGLLDGITTNPSLIEKASEKYHPELEKYIKQLLKTAGNVPVSLEVEGGNAEQMVQQGLSLWKRFKKRGNIVYIKIPIDPTLKKPIHYEGLKAIHELSKRKIPVNVTLVFTPEQALLAAKAGATVVSPFVGRVDDKIRKDNKITFKKHDYFPAEGVKKRGKHLTDNGIYSGVDLVKKIRALFDQNNIQTGILAASLRNPRQVREVILAGADMVTIPFSVIEELIQHPQTTEGMKKFEKAIVPAYRKLL